MPLTSGKYVCQRAQRHLSASDESAALSAVPVSVKGDDSSQRFRLSKDFWLCLDDGLLGKHGDPVEVRVMLKGKPHRVWVEQRAKDKFGLIPTEEDGDYSNQFLGVDPSGELTVSSSWGEQETWTISAN